MTYYYVIYFKSTPNSIYIGKTERTLSRRLYEHLWEMGRGKKSKLYNWLRKYSKVEEPSIEYLTFSYEFEECKEVSLISEYTNLGFKIKNSTKGGDGIQKGYKHTKEVCEACRTRAKLRKSFVGEANPFYGKSGQQNHKSKRVHQYSLEGEYLRSYDSMRLASIAIGKINTRLIHRATETKEIAYGYLWRKRKLKSVKSKQYLHKKMTSEDIILAIELHSSGISFNQISKRLKFSRSQVTKKIRNELQKTNG